MPNNKVANNFVWKKVLILFPKKKCCEKVMPIFLSKVVHCPYLRIQLPKTFFTYCGQVLLE